jgi:CRP-like cAMP-binding protein
LISKEKRLNGGEEGGIINRMNVEKYIQESFFFKQLNEAHHRNLAEICAIRLYSKRSYLFHEGEKGGMMFLLVDGNVQLHKNTEDGREVVIRVVGPGDVFAEVILFEQDCYPVSARAVTAVQALAFPREGIHRLLVQEGFRNDFIAALMEKQRYLTQRIQDLTTKDVEQRFFLFLRNQYGARGEIKTPLSKKDIAAAIGTTPESLSRLIQRLQEEQIIRWEGPCIEVLTDPWKYLE